ncbi:hypothetical protein XSR1_80083 [Xenorhabdus szentirmaii DSM 16338]|uniref:Uncharacterized protein n=1 Tax=Xenorhabdus szentirmaii DSM 16338 TaxID=1427518 RepID=W1J6B0_9GAMM|nr:hypothetical protein XSR1_80083 [Xenorhabdus szentirmaii DSM 16338]
MHNEFQNIARYTGSIEPKIDNLTASSIIRNHHRNNTHCS